MQIFHKRTDNSKNERCQGFQNFTFQFIYAQRSKKCMMVCNSKLCKKSMYYAPLYAAICNYSKRLHLSHVNPFLKLKNLIKTPAPIRLGAPNTSAARPSTCRRCSKSRCSAHMKARRLIHCGRRPRAATLLRVPHGHTRPRGAAVPRCSAASQLRAHACAWRDRVRGTHARCRWPTQAHTRRERPARKSAAAGAARAPLPR